MQLEEYLRRDDRIVLPLGSTEQHAYLSLATDNILAERVSVDAGGAARRAGAPGAAVRDHAALRRLPGQSRRCASRPSSRSSPTCSTRSRARASAGSCSSTATAGTRPPERRRPQWGAKHPEARVRYHDWWNSPRVMDVVRSVDPVGSHASWMENFPGRASRASSFRTRASRRPIRPFTTRPSSGSSWATAPSAASTSTPTRTCSASGRRASRRFAPCSRTAG